MIAARSARNACPICRTAVTGILERNRAALPLRRPLGASSLPIHPKPRSLPIRAYSSASQQQQIPPQENPSEELLAPEAPENIEHVVRQAKQRFRDTLPKGYLTDEEYKLYERLYGPPLRETDPEDVGIPQHADLLAGREVPSAKAADSLETTGTVVTPEGETAAEEPTEPSPEIPDGYVGMVARNKREYDALMKLEKDFKAAAEIAKEMAAEEDAAPGRRSRSVDLMQEVDEHYEKDHRLEYDEDAAEEAEDLFGPRSRSHPLTEEGRFGPSPATIQIPKDTFVGPIAELLGRADLGHVKDAAEKAYGGPGIPDSAITPPGMRNRPMLAMPLQAGHYRMSEIDADAYIATYLPQMYAASTSALVEVRKRLGTQWLRDLLARNGGEGPRMLDAGGGGAGLAAWQDIVEAEWEVMKEEGLARGQYPPGKRTVVIGSENLRQRVSQFLHRTTFLPRLPEYHHAADITENLDDPGRARQPRKTFDVILASHLLLQQPEGHRRKAILNTLWSLLSPEGGVLVVLEKGHPRGFEAVADVRAKLLDEYILHPESAEPAMDEGAAFRRVREPGMIVAPCTNHKQCPMYLVPGKAAGRKDVCSFSQRFVRPPFLHRIMDGRDRNHDDVEFSYIAVRRGVSLPEAVQQGKEAADKAFEGFGDAGRQRQQQQQSPEGEEESPHPMSLPRNVSRPLKRHGHVLLDLCTPAGKLERWIVPQSHGRQEYRDARKAKWGDLWALGAKTRTERKVRLGRGAGVPDDGGVRARRAREKKKTKVIELGYDASGIKEAVERGSRKGEPGQRRSKGRKAAKKSLLEDLMED